MFAFLGKILGKKTFMRATTLALNNLKNIGQNMSSWHSKNASEVIVLLDRINVHLSHLVSPLGWVPDFGAVAIGLEVDSWRGHPLGS